MQSDLLNCCICCLLYNHSNHVPKLIPTCGHTICSNCLDRVLTMQQKPRCCPLDRIPLPLNCDTSEIFPTNMLVLQLLDEKLRLENGFCNLHREIKTLICITDRCKICRFCVEDRLHRGHYIKYAKDIKEEADTKRKTLQYMVDDFDIHRKAIDTVLKEEKKAILSIVLEHCESMRELINQKEKEMCTEIESALDLEKIEADRRIEKDVALKKNLQAKISDLARTIMDERFFRTLTSHVHPFSIKEEYDRICRMIQTVKKNILASLGTFHQSLISLLKEVELVFPSCEVSESRSEVYSEDQRDLKSFNIKSLLKVDLQDNQLFIAPKTLTQDSTINGSPMTLGQLKKVRQMSFSFNEEKLTEKTFEAIKYVWPEMKEVISLDINFSNQAVTDQELFIFSSDPFWANDKITSFYIDLDTASVSDQSVVLFMTKALAKMPNLKYFSIILCDTKITDKSLTTFAANVVPIMSGVENLNLDLCNTQLTDLSMRHLFTKMREFMKNIQSFRLCVSNTKVADISMEFFSRESLLNMVDLDTFKLYLYDTQVTDLSIEQLCINMGMVMRKVKAFLLSLGKTRITDKSLLAFSRSTLATMEAIETFGLFLDYTKVTDLGLRQLCASMKDIMRKVKVFKLNLQRTEITDKSMEALVKQVFWDMNDLKELELDLTGTHITDRSLKQFSMKIKSLMANVETFSLKLQDTRVSNKCIEELICQIDPGSMAALKSFQLDIDERQTNVQIQSLLDNIQQQLLLKESSY